MTKEKWDVNSPDSFEPLETGLRLNRKDGLYDSYAEAKKELLESIQANIRNLRHYEKQVRASKKSDWMNSEAEAEE